MTREKLLSHRFVEFIPEVIEEGTLYVSIEYATVSHKCCCGCGFEVITPLSPTDWQLTFDGEPISLDPSIGNWSFKCQSHYWIRKSHVQLAPRWSRQEIEAGRQWDRQQKEDYYKETGGVPEAAQRPEAASVAQPNRWERFKVWCKNLW